jgi:secreted PhoX family phosphatase
MSGIDRRRFIQGGVATAAGVAFAGPFAGLVSRAAGVSAATPFTYGPLIPVADKRDGVVRLDLPDGFEYRSFNVTGQPAAGLSALPGRPDGMAAFPGPRANLYTLVRNHEIQSNARTLFGDPATAYDTKVGGGCTTVVVDRHGKVADGWVSLNGTEFNCAGGPMPWGSWLSCEETINGPDVGSDFLGSPNGVLEEKHGYVFDVPAGGVSDGMPIRSAGRFAHEAAAYDPDGGAVYLTEDNFGFPSGFYRYTPPQNPMATGRLVDGGTLEMLAVVGDPNADLTVALGNGTSFDTTWVEIDDPDPTFAPGTTNDQAIQAVGNQGRAKGAALFSRLEGCWHRNGIVYFTSTQGGPTDYVGSGYGMGRGQVWAYEPASDTLTLVFESPGSAVLDLPDNITITPNGALLLCEDGGGDNFLRGLSPDGQLFDFARNADPALQGQEFAGATFSPDGKTLFVNIQASRSYTIAIWGPWARGPF